MAEALKGPFQPYGLPLDITKEGVWVRACARSGVHFSSERVVWLRPVSRLPSVDGLPTTSAARREAKGSVNPWVHVGRLR